MVNSENILPVELAKSLKLEEEEKEKLLSKAKVWADFLESEAWALWMEWAESLEKGLAHKAAYEVDDIERNSAHKDLLAFQRMRLLPIQIQNKILEIRTLKEAESQLGDSPQSQA